MKILSKYRYPKNYNNHEIFKLDDDSNRLLIHMKRESCRLASFTHWTKPFISPADLAKAGFFYLNRRDSCRCAFCGNFVGMYIV